MGKEIQRYLPQGAKKLRIVIFSYRYSLISKLIRTFASSFDKQKAIHMEKKFTIALLGLMLCMGAMAQKVPAVTLRTIDGQTVRTDTLSNHGRPIIIDFFATWCKPCNRELTAISEVYDEWQEETGVKLIAVSIDQAQNINKVKPLVDNHNWPYEVLLDPNSDFKRALGIQMIPYVLIIDGEGNIVYRHNGYTEGAEEELIEKVRELTKP